MGSWWLSESGSQGYRYPCALPLYNTPLWPLLGPKTGGRKWPVPINRLFMSSPKTHWFCTLYVYYPILSLLSGLLCVF